MDERKFWLGFSLIPDVGPKRIFHLHNQFGDLETAWAAGAQRLQDVGFSKKLAAQIVEKRKQIRLDYEWERVKRVDAFILTPLQDDYPPLLKNTDDPPAVLYIRGTLYPEDSRAVCIVGTRKATVYGQDVAYKLASDLASQGVTVVSGLAQGIDSAAHQGALDAGGRTIGVMGNGISEVYPDDSLELARDVITQGCVMTEFALDTPPIGRNFPRRNRIMSGMAHGVVVVEAGERSGSLITAGLAGEQGRDVFAVPHNIFNPEGRGANHLIQDGAKLVMGADDVLEEIDAAHQFVEVSTKAAAIAPENETRSSFWNCWRRTRFMWMIWCV